MPIDQLKQFLGWCTVLHIGLLIFSTVSILFFQEQTIRAHKKFFKIEKDFFPKAYFLYLAAYKVMVLVFFLIPYVALCFV